MPKWRMKWLFDGDTEYKPANLGVPFFPDKPVYIYIMIICIYIYIYITLYIYCIIYIISYNI